MSNIINFGDNTELNGTAIAEDVLENKTFYNTDPEMLIEGTMPNNGAVSNIGTVAVGGTNTYTIPQGYHDGTGTSVITGPILNGNASVSNVLNAKTFYSNSGTKQTGTMVNNGAVNQTVGIGGSYTVPKGYHNGSGKVKGPTLTASHTVASKEQILSGYSAFDTAGNELVGELIALNAANFSIYNGTSSGYQKTFSAVKGKKYLLIITGFAYSTITITGATVNSSSSFASAPSTYTALTTARIVTATGTSVKVSINNTTGGNMSLMVIQI